MLGYIPVRKQKGLYESKTFVLKRSLYLNNYLVRLPIVLCDLSSQVYQRADGLHDKRSDQS